ncbi:hypothetical protein [Streptomyces minutiscleroticus]|uniref:hypothetical protein n=1 Tax=Streptomyces minutiscleroticus TaxID=68238 RepID=UPI0033284FED
MITPNRATPEGAAIVDLHQEMLGLRERYDELPGAEVVPVLEHWLTRFDFTTPADFHMHPPQETWSLPLGDPPEEAHAGELRTETAARPFPSRQECILANTTAVFHELDGPRGEGLPCLEVAGVLVFLYLDPRRKTVRVSVHLDSTAEHLVRPDGTVPLHVEVEDTVVFSAGAARPASPWCRIIRRLTRRIRRSTRR